VPVSGCWNWREEPPRWRPTAARRTAWTNSADHQAHTERKELELAEYKLRYDNLRRETGLGGKENR